MKLFHLSDLHLGKRVCERSLTDDQRDILNQITAEIKARKPDAVMIAGDVYDRSVPPEEAVALFDDFLFALSELKTNVLMIGGNHDSAERLSFGGRIMNRSGIYISPEFNAANYGKIITPTVLCDEFGEVNFYLLPFITPAAVRAARKNTDIASWTDAVKTVISDMNPDTSKRNILIAHQFVTGASTCMSETFSAGGADNVDASVFEPFDYVALGHLHGKQFVGKETIRYCGTPLKYSFSEVRHHKSITVVDVSEKGQLSVSEIPLDKPLHDWRELRGTFDEVTSSGRSDDYIRVVLKDNDEVYDAITKLREYFPNIMQLAYDNDRTLAEYEFKTVDDLQRLSPTDMFAEFYRQQRNEDMNAEQMKIVREIFEEIGEKAK